MPINGPPREMTRAELHEYVHMLDLPLQEIFAKVERLSSEQADVLSDEYRILAGLFGVFDGFAQRWHDAQESPDV